MHPALSHPPKLSKGRITPNVIRDFENHAKNFFMNAKHGVPDNEKVARILGCFEDRLVNDWISVNRKCLRTLEFEQFMDEFRSRWLPKTWVEDLRNNILGSRLDPKLTTFKACVTIRTYRPVFIYLTRCTDTGVIVTHALSFYRPLAPLFC